MFSFINATSQPVHQANNDWSRSDLKREAQQDWDLANGSCLGVHPWARTILQSARPNCVSGVMMMMMMILVIGAAAAFTECQVWALTLC